MKTTLFLFLTFLATIYFTLSCPAETLEVGAFSSLDPDQGLPASWQALTFPRIHRHTQYTLIRLDARTVLMASSIASASGMMRTMGIDPMHFPWLTWSWRVQNILQKGDVTRKQGDDYPARIYVAFAFEAEKAGFWQRTRHKAASLAAGRELPGSVLNYIWASHAPAGLFVENPYAPQAKMIVVRSGTKQLNQWVSERRNILEDYQKAFGRQPPVIIAVAVMTDTDNTGEKAVAYYGDIILKSE